jgi:WD40 repeat protein
MRSSHSIIGSACIATMSFMLMALTKAGAAEDFTPAQPVFRLEFSPDNQYLAAAIGTKMGGHFAIYNVADGTIAKKHFAPLGGLDLDYSPDGNWLALATRSPRVMIVSAESWMVRSEWDAPGNVLSVAFSPDGKIVATGCAENATIELRAADTGELLRTLDGHVKGVMYVAFSPDGDYLLSGGNDNIARLWLLKEGKAIHTLGPYLSIVRRVAFSRDGKFFLTATWDGYARIFKAPSGELLASFRGGHYSADLHPSGRWLVASNFDAGAVVYEIDLNEPAADEERRIRELIARFEDDDYNIRETATAELTAVGMVAAPLLKEAMESDDAEVRIRARNVRAAVRSPRPLVELRGHDGNIEAAVFSPDGKLLATGCRGGIIKLWDTSDWKETRTLALPANEN